MGNRKKSLLALSIILMIVFSLSLMGCNSDPLKSKLEKKGYVVEITVPEKNSAIEHSISKQISAFNTKTGDQVHIAEYKTKELAKEFYEKNKNLNTSANHKIAIKGKRVAYGTVDALKVIKYIRK